MAKKSTKKSPKAPKAKPQAAVAEQSTESASSKKTTTVKTRMAGYVVLVKGKPLALATGEGKPKNGVLERNERATLFTRLQGAQGAINRTAKYGEGKKGALTADNCVIVRVDHLPTA